MFKKLIFIAVFFPIFITAVLPAHAEIDKKEVQIIARTLNFISEIPKGDLTVAIITNNTIEESSTEASNLMNIMQNGMKVGKFNLQSKLVDTSNLTSLDGSNIAIITSGLQANYDTIASDISSRNLLSVTSDFACVDAGKCVMGISSQPKVEIIVSQDAVTASNLTMSKGLSFMIKMR